MDNLNCSDFDFSFFQQSNKENIHQLYIPFQKDDLVKPDAM